MNAHEFQAALQAIDLDAVPVMSADRSIARKEQAKLARHLFRQLGLKGISVTCPNYSMARSVNILLPKRKDYTRDAAGYVEWSTDPVAIANTAGRQRVRDILDRAFPNHDDRSDVQSDHFDFCWSIH